MALPFPGQQRKLPPGANLTVSTYMPDSALP